MDPIFDFYPLRQIWFDGFIGKFGWLEYGFANWVYDLALVIALVILGLVLALYGALIVIAARGAGKRYGPALGVLVVCISVAHTAAAMLLTLSRYYG
jgi:hypothetical protein